jgi:hypothetical protein
MTVLFSSRERTFRLALIFNRRYRGGQEIKKRFEAHPA